MQAPARIGGSATEVIAVSTAGSGSSLMDLSSLKAGVAQRELDDAMDCLKASKNIDSYVKEAAYHAPQYLYRVYLCRDVLRFSGREDQVQAQTEWLTCARFGKALYMAEFSSVVEASRIQYNVVVIEFSGPGLDRVVVRKKLPSNLDTVVNFASATADPRHKILVTTMFSVRPVFTGATRPRHPPAVSFAPAEIIDKVRKVMLDSDAMATERAVAQSASTQLNRRAAKTLAKAAKQAVRPDKTIVSTNYFAELAEEDPDAAYVSGYCGVPVLDPQAMRVLHSLRINNGSRQRARKHAPGGDEPQTRDKNWRNCVRRLKKSALKLRPTSVAYVAGACQGTELPKPLRAALKRNLRASSSKFVSLRLLKSKFFRPLTFDQNVTVSNVKIIREAPKALRSKFLRLADSCSPTAYKARSQVVTKKAA